MKKQLLTFTVIAALAACQNRDAGKLQVDRVAFPPPAPEAMADLAMADPGVKSIETASTADYKDNVPGDKQSGVEISKKVVKEGEVSFETGNIHETRQVLMQNMKRLGGYLDEEREYKGETERKEYLLKVRIPAQNFEKFLSAVNETADRIESKSIRIRDVTTEYIDVTTRLNNKKLLENRYKALLQQSTKMSDILAVENKLSDIRTDIEATQGQLNYLSKQIAYSTLDVTFFTKANISAGKGNGFSYQFRNALDNSWQLLQNLFFGLITVWPIIALLLIIWFAFKVWRKRRTNRTRAV